MWTTRIGMVTLLCGWLATPAAFAGATATEEEAPYTEEAPDEMGEPVDLSAFILGEPEALDSPRIRYAEPLSCPAAPGGQVWIADTEECDGDTCVRETTAWIGEWTLEDTELEVQCETDRIVVRWDGRETVLEPNAEGDLDITDPGEPAAPEEAEATAAGTPPAEAPASET